MGAPISGVVQDMELVLDDGMSQFAVLLLSQSQDGCCFEMFYNPFEPLSGLRQDLTPAMMGRSHPEERDMAWLPKALSTLFRGRSKFRNQIDSQDLDVENQRRLYTGLSW